ncbi:MAG: hypothetical protein KIT36_21150, partial [Alphaproteobacteria bacterium]|nr:hypothetical protein [Alphaproteobacteria bacterium]
VASAPPPRVEEYRGGGRIILYGGTDPNAYADYSVTLKVTGSTVSAVVTRACATCGSGGGQENRVFACTPAPLRDDGSYNLRCNGVYVWGNLQQAKVHYSAIAVDLPLKRVEEAGG